ncbi:hypothetical protein FB451DRAFT_1175165 [Mycena latifolia]|nr:hypothetical protein FB451DRAFT_1175165 [Mycena latifolia]
MQYTIHLQLVSLVALLIASGARARDRGYNEIIRAAPPADNAPTGGDNRAPAAGDNSAPTPADDDPTATDTAVLDSPTILSAPVLPNPAGLTNADDDQTNCGCSREDSFADFLYNMHKLVDLGYDKMDTDSAMAPRPAPTVVPLVRRIPQTTPPARHLSFSAAPRQHKFAVSLEQTRS